MFDSRPLKSRLSCDFMDASSMLQSASQASGGAGGHHGAFGGHPHHHHHSTGPLHNGHPSQAKEETSGWSRFRLLLWKNWVVQKRHKIQTLVEIALPVFFASLLVVIRHLAPADVYHNATIYPAYRIAKLPNIPSASIVNMPLPPVGSKVRVLLSVTSLDLRRP